MVLSAVVTTNESSETMADATEVSARTQARAALMLDSVAVLSKVAVAPPLLASSAFLPPRSGRFQRYPSPPRVSMRSCTRHACITRARLLGAAAGDKAHGLPV